MVRVIRVPIHCPTARRPDIVQTPIEPWRRGRFDAGLLFPLLLPLGLLLVYKSWIFTYPSFLDPWYSLGYYMQLGDTVRLAPDYYPSSRVAAWLPGAAAYAVLPPLAANYALRLAFYWLAAFSLYLLLRREC